MGHLSPSYWAISFIPTLIFIIALLHGCAVNSVRTLKIVLISTPNHTVMLLLKAHSNSSCIEETGGIDRNATRNK